VFFQVLSHQGESDCGSDVALPLHPAVIGDFLTTDQNKTLIAKIYNIISPEMFIKLWK
jgi:hypothetical protein